MYGARRDDVSTEHWTEHPPTFQASDEGRDFVVVNFGTQTAQPARRGRGRRRGHGPALTALRCVSDFSPTTGAVRCGAVPAVEVSAVHRQRSQLATNRHTAALNQVPNQRLLHLWLCPLHVTRPGREAERCSAIATSVCSQDFDIKIHAAVRNQLLPDDVIADHESSRATSTTPTDVSHCDDSAQFKFTVTSPALM